MGTGDARTFKVNFSAGGVEKLKERVREKLKEFMGDYTDDTLVEYVIVLLRNGRNKEEAKSELNVFLGDDSASFVSWLWDHLTSHLELYVHKLVENKSLASKVRSVVEELSDINEPSAGADNVSKEQRKRDWKGSLRDSQKSFTRHGQEHPAISLEENERQTPTQELSSPSEQRKRRRHDESVPRKKDSSQSTTDAPRRLLQFAVRDAVENCKQTGASKDSQKAIPSIRSVVSTSTESPQLPDQRPRRIQSIAHVLPGMSAVFRAVQEAAEDVKSVRSRRSVFDRIGRNMDVDVTRNSVTHSRDEDEEDKFLEDDELAHGIAENDTKLLFASSSDSAHDEDDVNNRHIRVLNVSARKRHPEYELREAVESSPNGLNIASDGTSMPRSEEILIPSNSFQAVKEGFNPSILSSMKYVRPRDAREMISKQNVKINSKVEPNLLISETYVSDIESLQTVKGTEDIQNVSQKLVASNTALLAASQPFEDVDSRTIFVTNVNFSATKDSLSRHFNKFGEILKVNIVTDHTTRQPTGSAYVEFTQKEAADNALSLDGSIFLSRKLRVLKRSSENKESTTNNIRGRLPARGLSYSGSRFSRVPFCRGSQGRYRSPKLGMRSFQWKRGDAQVNGSESGSLPRTPSSLTYIRSESKPAANSGTS